MEGVPYDQRTYRMINSIDGKVIADAKFNIPEEQGREVLRVGGRIPMVDMALHMNNSKRSYWWEIINLVVNPQDSTRYDMYLKPTGEECHIARPHWDNGEKDEGIDRTGEDGWMKK